MNQPRTTRTSDATDSQRTDATDDTDTHRASLQSPTTGATDDPDADPQVGGDPAPASAYDLDGDVNTDAAAVAGALESFVEQVTDALAAAEAPEDTVAAVTDSGAELTAQVTAAVNAASTAAPDGTVDPDRVAALEDRVTELETALATERQTRAKEAAEDRKRLHELETRVEPNGEVGLAEASATADTEPEASVPAETPLEEIVRLPDQLATDQLTANQRRARFLTKGVREYTRRVPAGRSLKTSELRRVLAANEETAVHSETVSRVVGFLDELGQDAVRVTESKAGERVVVFTDAFVERVTTAHKRAETHTVVTDTGVTG